LNENKKTVKMETQIALNIFAKLGNLIQSNLTKQD